MDDRLLDATVAVLAKYGPAGLTLERVAEQVGRSRVTLWRQQVTPEALVDGLLARLTRDYRDAMWPALTEAGTGLERMLAALDALCGVAEAHLHLLGAVDDAFDRASARMRDITGQSFSFLDPFPTAMRAGLTDGTLSSPIASAEDAGTAIFATTCWGYVHLRLRQGWPAERAQPATVALALAALTPSQPSNKRRPRR